MAIFIWMYILLILNWALSTHLKTKKRKKYAWLSGLLILWLIQALRSTSVGIDLQVYIPQFLDENRRNFLSFEIGYIKLNELIYSISSNENAFLAGVSMLSLLPISLLFKKYSASIFFSYIIFASFIIYHFTFSGLRQALALGIIAISYYFLERKNLIYFIGVIFLASLFHVSSILFLIMYPLCNLIKMTNKKYFIFCIIAILFIIALRPIVSFIIPLIFGEGKYIGYIDRETVPAYNLFIVLFIFFLFTFTVKRPSKNLMNYRMATFCAVFCQSLGFISPVATRIGYYFILFIPLALPQVIQEMKQPKKYKTIITSVIAAFMIFFFFYSNATGYLNVIPYSFFWEK